MHSLHLPAPVHADAAFPPGQGQTSREAHAKQKQLIKERKAAKPLADEGHRLKKIWEKLRRKSHIAKDERQRLVDELYAIVTGRMKEFAMKHDTVRAVQTAIKYSTPAQRKQIAQELAGNYSDLAESKYAKFLIAKLLVQKDKEIRDAIIPEFYGKVRRLINHAEASWILDDIYRGVATKQQQARLLREWYGPEFALFTPSPDVELSADLGQILEEWPSKRGTVMKYLFDTINGLMQKKMTGFTMLHDAMLQYFLCLKPEGEEMKEFFEAVKDDENGDLLKNMAFTRPGARLVCLLLAYGSAKDRRTILKTYKDTLQMMCGDDHGHTVILAAYDLIDDTVMTSKAIFPELVSKRDEKSVEEMIFLANNRNARTTICYLFEGASKALFPPSHAGDLAILAEIHEIRERTSKKKAETRRQELIGALSPPLLAAIARSARDLVSTSFGCHFVAEALLSAVGDRSAAVRAIADTAAGDPKDSQPQGVYPPPPPHLALTPHGGKMFKMLNAGGRYDKASGTIKQTDPPLGFADVFYEVIKEHVVAWATGPSAFTILGLLESCDFSQVEELKTTLRAHRGELQTAASRETAEQEAKREEAGAQVQDGKKDRKGKRDGKEKKAAVGNAGARMLLAAL